MSLLGDLRKVLFGVKSVSKSAANKAAESAKEAGQELRDRGEEFLDKAIDKGSDLAGEVREKVGDVTDKAGDALSNLTESIWEEAENVVEKGKDLKDKAEDWLSDKTSTGINYEDDDLVPDVGAKKEPIDFEADLDAPATPKEPSQLAQTADDLLNKAAHAGNDALETASKAGEKLMDVSEKVGEKVIDAGSKVWDRLKEAGGDLMDKAEDLVEKAGDEVNKETMEDAVAKAERLQKEAQERADNALSDTKDSLLEGKDDFFAKAARFADGDYHNTGKMEEGHMEIRENPDYEPKKIEGTIPGLEDLDGDGDELIDDAIIEEEE